MYLSDKTFSSGTLDPQSSEDAHKDQPDQRPRQDGSIPAPQHGQRNDAEV